MIINICQHLYGKGMTKPITRFTRYFAHLTHPPTPSLATSGFIKTKNIKTKKMLQMVAIAMLSLPAKSLTTFEHGMANNATFNTALGGDAHAKVMMRQELTVAAVHGDSTFFSIDGFEHGFGYDLTRGYANDLGVTLNLLSYDDEQDALDAVRFGDVDMALTVASSRMINDMGLSELNLSCGRDATLTRHGLNPKISWTFKEGSDALALHASHYICDDVQVLNTAKIAHFYNQNLLKDDYNQQHFAKALTEKLPNYKSSFQTHADEYNHDWELLVAMGYQESHLNANAISPTGVEGIMMLTNSTAKQMGVSNRVDPMQSIRGGAKYLELLKAEFADVPAPDRIWFALAAYNMGPYAVKDIQAKLSQGGKDANSWSNVYAYLADNAQSNGRYVQCMHYVSNIRSYLEEMKLQSV